MPDRMSKEIVKGMTMILYLVPRLLTWPSPVPPLPTGVAGRIRHAGELLRATTLPLVLRPLCRCRGAVVDLDWRDVRGCYGWLASGPATLRFGQPELAFHLDPVESLFLVAELDHFVAIAAQHTCTVREQVKRGLPAATRGMRAVAGRTRARKSGCHVAACEDLEVDEERAQGRERRGGNGEAALDDAPDSQIGEVGEVVRIVHEFFCIGYARYRGDGSPEILVNLTGYR